MLLGLANAAVLAAGSTPKALSMVVLGVLLGLAGQDIKTVAFLFNLAPPAHAARFDFLAAADSSLPGLPPFHTIATVLSDFDGAALLPPRFATPRPDSRCDRELRESR